MLFDRRLFALTRGERPWIAAAALAGLASVPLEIWRLVLMGTALALLFGGAPVANLSSTVALIAALLVARAGLAVLKERLANGVAARVKTRLRRRLYEQILRLGPGHFQADQRRTGATTTALVDGVERVDSFFGRYLSQLVVALVSPLIVFGFIAALDVQTAAILVVFALLTIAAPVLTSRALVRASRFWRETYTDLGAEVLDSVQGLPTLKAFGQSGQRGELLGRRAAALYRATVGVLAGDIVTYSLSRVVMAVGAAVALAWGAARVQAGSLDLTTLFVVLLVGAEAFRPVRELVALYHAGVWATGASQAISALLDTPPAVSDTGTDLTPDSGRPVPGDRKESPPDQHPLPFGDGGQRVRSEPTIRFEAVTFGYQQGRRPALADVSFDLAAGETLGVVGPSGAGKSTVVNLVLRLADPQSGRVLVGGHDVRDLPLDVLRRQVAVVAQDTYLFHGTVADNLRLGRPDATSAALEAACRAANAHEFVAVLPQGYDTPIGERGTKLSGGQRQRLAIARALLRHAPILVLDEALSSVDAENEATIQEALERLRRGRTTLVIAHRLSSVAGADRIVVLERGRLVEQGTHAELLARPGGAYARLMASQRVVEEDRAAERMAVALSTAAATRAAPLGAAPNGVSGVSMEAPGGPVIAAATSEARPSGAGNGLSTDPGGEPATTAASRVAPDGAPNGQSVDATGKLARSAVDERGAAPLLPAGRVWPRLAAIARARLWEVPIAFVVNALRALSAVAVAAAGALLVARVAAGQPLDAWIPAYLALAVAATALAAADVFVLHDLAFWLLGRMRVTLYRLLEPLMPAYLQQRRSGDLVSLATGDMETVELFFAHTVPPLMSAGFTSGAVLLGLALIAPPVALVLLPFVVLVALTPLIAGRAAARLGAQLREELGALSAHIADGVQGLTTVVAFGHGPARAAEVEALGRRLGRLQVRFRSYEAVQHGVVEVLVGLGGLAVLLVGAALVATGRMDRGLLALVTVTAVAAFGPMAEVVQTVKQLMETLGSARRYFALEDEPIPVRDGPDVADSGTNGRTDSGVALAFENVTFWYESPARPALRGVSFRVGAGEAVALVGRSGAGKTTAAHLALRYWDPCLPLASAQLPGRILLDGRDLRDFTLDDLRRRIALVDQDTYLFNESLMENLRLGRPEATDAEVLAAARAARVDEFAQALPDGYATVVGERGLGLSGGQRQRVAIARALLKDAPLLVLDEATSHLDAVNEAEVREALGTLMRGRTTLVIAHRLSTIRDADRIVVLDAGRVAEQGQHADLLARDGLYAHLIGAQLIAQSREAHGALLELSKVGPAGG